MINMIEKLPKTLEQRKELIKRIKLQIKKIETGPKRNSKHNQLKKGLLEERIQLIECCKQLNETRIKNLQRLFKHYCTHVFKTGKNYNFDAIGYANQHLIVERLFAMINDFKLNEIIINQEPKAIVSDRNQIILLFKQCSSNARHLELSQFITCLERLFVLLFDANKNYDANQKKLKEQKRNRKLQMKEREKKRKQKLKAKKQAALGQQILINTQVKSQQKKSQKVLIKQQKQVAKQSKQQKGNQSAQNKGKNDQIIKEMMKDFQIVNPTDEINNAVKQLNSTQEQHQQTDELFIFTNQQKVESYMQKINIDNIKQVLKKMRYFEKANFKYTQVQELQKFKDVKKKTPQRVIQNGSGLMRKDKELVLIHEEWKGDKKQIQISRIQKFLTLSKKLQERQISKSKKHLSERLSKDNYNLKKSKFDQQFTKKQQMLMDPHVLKRLTRRKEQQQQPVQYSLDMIHRSTPNQLPINKINPQRYLSSDPTDPIFMNQYSDHSNHRLRARANSGVSHNNSMIIENAKRRVKEVETQQQRKLNPNRQTYNMYKHHHYLQKFLQRKW